jgi:hypothetical protein
MQPWIKVWLMLAAIVFASAAITLGFIAPPFNLAQALQIALLSATAATGVLSLIEWLRLTRGKRR